VAFSLTISAFSFSVRGSFGLSPSLLFHGISAKSRNESLSLLSLLTPSPLPWRYQEVPPLFPSPRPFPPPPRLCLPGAGLLSLVVAPSALHSRRSLVRPLPGLDRPFSTTFLAPGWGFFYASLGYADLSISSPSPSDHSSSFLAAIGCFMAAMSPPRTVEPTSPSSPE